MPSPSTEMTPVTGGFLARHRVALICLALALGTLALYWPVTHSAFINVDDTRFVVENDQVRAGLTWHGIVWALHTFYVETWQPVTWVSHMLDCQLFGLNAGGHHLTSLLIHVASSVLLFLWLNNLTRATGRSIVVAALFAWHPLHVESVAWICERKDVLSTLFWMLALPAYTRYARRGGLGWYVLALGLFALGLMSKPMVITLPCVLLLLDFWPLNRLALTIHCEAAPPGRVPAGRLVTAAARAWPFPGGNRRWLAGPDDQWRSLAGRGAALVCEKIPFFLVALGMAAATVYAEKSGGTLADLSSFPLTQRATNAAVIYASYLSTTFCPVGLAFYYPYTHHLPAASVIGAALLLALLTASFLVTLRSRPCLLIGWLWWLGTLVPTIGLIQFCLQSRADRYMYIPSIGLFITVVWGVASLLQRHPSARNLLPWLAGAALAGCLATTSVQVRYWQNSLTLARHAIEVTDGNYVAYESLGRSISSMGQPDRAVSFFAEASRLAPTWPQGQFNYGYTLALVGDTNGAIEHLRSAVNLAPGFAEGHLRLGEVLLKFDRSGEAVREFAEAARLDPQSAATQCQWGTALARDHKTAEAVSHFNEALRLKPDYPEARRALEQLQAAPAGPK